MVYDTVVIGGGQSALACAYYLNREGLHFLLLDANDEPGGAWLNGWDSLTLFSPAEHSSLPGWMMPPSLGQFPTRDEVIQYVSKYEQRYAFNVLRSKRVIDVRLEQGIFNINTNSGDYRAKSVISATGTLHKPFIPNFKGLDEFHGTQIHSVFYRNPTDFIGKNVLIVGEGNSGAQILAEVSKVANCYWATRKAPEFLPDDVDGRVLFDSASAIYYAKKKGIELDMKTLNLGNIVMVPSVMEARSRGVLVSSGQLARFTHDSVIWENNEETAMDAVIWCTGFGFATDHLKNLVARDERGKVSTEGTASTEVEGLFLVGYGGWTGFASATLIGVGRSAKKTASQIKEFIGKSLE